MYNLSSTPTPLKQNTPYNLDKNFFPCQTPGQTPGAIPNHTPNANPQSMNMSPNLSFGKEQPNNQNYFFPQPTQQPAKDTTNKEAVTFGSNDESFGAIAAKQKNTSP